jgi:hypothetical protein
MSDLQKTWCYAQPDKDGRKFRVEESMDGQPFRSPLFAPMNGCTAEQALPPGQCREPQLQACGKDPWGWTSGELGCWGSSMCSALRNPRTQFCCKNGTCRTLPQKEPGCQAPAFRRTFPGNVVKQNFNIPMLSSLPYRLPIQDIPPAKPFAWTVNRPIALIRSQRPGFDLTMYGKDVL